MKQTLYGDVLFLVNFSMDYLTLFITAKILHKDCPALKTALSAVIGGVYGVAACFIDWGVIPEILLNVSVSLMMCLIAFGKRNITASLALFYGSGLLLGGTMTAVFSRIGSISGTQTVFVEGEYRTVSQSIPLGYLALVSVITAAFAIVGGQYSRRKKTAREIPFSVTYKGNTVSFIGISDSGNLLREPISGKPVIILTGEAMKRLIPDDLFKIVSNFDLSRLTDASFESAERIRIIPQASVGGKSSLIGITTDKIKINNDDISAVIAYCGELSSFGGCDALIPSVLCS